MKRTKPPPITTVLLALGLLLLPPPAGVASPPPLKRVLMLFAYESTMPGFIDFKNSFQSVLDGSKDSPVDLYVECMDLTRFPESRHMDKLMELYRARYAGMKLDLIVAVQLQSLQFIMEYRNEPFLNVPVLLCAQDPRLIGEQIPLPGAAVLTSRLDFTGTVALALRIHPDVRHVFVVSGASRFDQVLESMAREDLSSFAQLVEVSYLSGLSIEELTERTAKLPERSLILYLSVFQDGSGRIYKSPEALTLIANRANAPIYGLSESYVGSGIVGGHMVNHSALGASAGQAALRLLRGESLPKILSTDDDGSRYIFDARSLKRWGIREESLPKGSEIRYREYLLQETYHWQIIGATSLVVLEALLIWSLITALRKQRRTERALQRAASEWQATFDSTTDMIMLLDKEFRIVRANAAVAAFTGLPRAEILTKPCSQVLQGLQNPPGDCPFAEAFYCGQHHESIVHDGARDAWLFVSTDPILGKDGDVLGFVHTVKDITERHRAAELIEASEEFNRAVLASLKSHVAILDHEGKILAVNQAWERFARESGAPSIDGLGPGANYLEVCRRSMLEPGDAASKALHGLLSVLDGKKEIFAMEYACDPPSGRRWFSMRVMPFKNPAGGAVVSHTEVTERKEAELEAAARSEELTHISRIITVGELATSLAHEINQPMTAILCNAEAAQRFLAAPEPDLEEVRTILADIIQDDKRAGEVIRRMRTLVKKKTPRDETVNLNDTIQETITLARSASLHGGVPVETQLDPELLEVKGDRVQLQQVLLNLMLNASAAMQDTPPALRKLMIRSAMLDSSTVQISIEDTGCGVKPESLGCLFTPFYTTKTDGLGMGLVISRTILKAHGGRIWAENNRGPGATFHFTVPLDHGEQP